MPSLSQPESQRLEAGDLAELHGFVWKHVEGAVKHLVKLAPRRQLYEALSTATPMDALINLVSQDAAAAEVALSVDDPLRAARARAAKRMSELLAAEGGPLPVTEVSQRLRIGRAGVDKRRRTGTLIGIDDGGRGVLYPGWQFTSTGLLRGLDTVLQALDVEDSWMKIEFFLSSDPVLAERPLDALRRGRLDEVTQSAKRFGRHGDDKPNPS